MKLIICGGHLTPALAVIDELKRLAPTLSIYFVGRMRAMEGDETPSLEYTTVVGRGVQFLPITTGRLPRYVSRTLFFSIIKLPVGIIQALWYVFSVRPTMVLSFGGYVSFPVCLAAFVGRVPIVIHEQAKEPGLANKIMAHMASIIFVSFKEHIAMFPPEKTLYTGLPIRAVLFHPPKEPTFPYEKNIPLLYVTGGATGAASLNALLFPIIKKLVKKYMIVHQTGSTSYQDAREIQLSLPTSQKTRYFVTPYIKEQDVSWVYCHATLVIGRAGANTVGEIAALGKIALFVPLPWAAANEQEENATFLKDAGSAIVFRQKQTTPEALYGGIEQMMQQRETYEKRARAFASTQPKNAATIIAKELIASARTS